MSPPGQFQGKATDMPNASSLAVAKDAPLHEWSAESFDSRESCEEARLNEQVRRANDYADMRKKYGDVDKLTQSRAVMLMSATSSRCVSSEDVR
jgi:hypothetical protein